MSPLSSRRAGFSLLEVLLALAITSATLIAVFNLISGSSSQVNAAQSLRIATALSQSLDDSIGEIVPLEPGTYDGEFKEAGFRWQATVTVEEEDQGSPSLNLMKIEYRILWSEVGRERSLSFETYRISAGARS